MKLHALTAIRDFDSLDGFAKSKRNSPIGWVPFVRHLVEKGYPREAATYVPKCAPAQRADLYVECGDWRAAGKECKERKDKAKLECVIWLSCWFDGLTQFTNNLGSSNGSAPTRSLLESLTRFLRLYNSLHKCVERFTWTYLHKQSNALLGR